MISTRLHGLIDWTVTAGMGGASASSTLSPRVRAVLGTTAAYHASYSAATDYAAGIRPWLSLRQHLILDAVGGAALVAAGAMSPRTRPAERALLVAAGIAELAVAAFSDTSHSQRSRPAVYQPVDTPKPVAENVFIVESQLDGALREVVPVRMTVIRLANGELLLHSPTRLTEQLKRDLQGLGRVAHLVAPNMVHWMFLPEWQRAYPDAVTWAAPGLRERRQVRKSGLRIDHVLGETAPASWGSSISLVMVPGGFGFSEAALFHRPSSTLVLTDLVLNLEASRLPALVRPIVRLVGSAAPDGLPSPVVRLLLKLRWRAAAKAANRLIDLAPERVIFAHGQWFQSGGTAALRHSLRWLLD